MEGSDLKNGLLQIYIKILNFSKISKVPIRYFIVYSLKN